MNNAFIRMLKDISKFKYLFYSAIVVSISSALVESIPPRIYSWGIDQIIIPKEYSNLVGFSIIYLVVVILIGGLTYTFIRLVGILELKFSFKLRNRVFKKVQRLHLQYFNENEDGWIIARITSDVSKLSEILSWQVVDSFYYIIMILVAFVSIILYSVKAGTIVILFYPVILGLIYIIKNQVLKKYRQVRRQNSIIISKYNELINGILTIKTMAIEGQNYNEFNMENYRLKKHSVTVIILSGLFSPVLLIVGYAMLGGVINTSVSEYLVGNLSIGEVSAALSYTIILIELTNEVTAIIAEVQNAQANAERIYTLLDTPVEIVDSPSVIAKYGDIFDEVKISKRAIGQVTFADVSFTYNNGLQIFDNLSIDIKAGTSVALVGQTGSGKTTFVNLISRFYEPDSGQIYIDGVNIQEQGFNWLHRNIGHVLQHPFLFKGTVYENIKYNSDVSNKEVDAVCKLLGIDKLITRLSKGLATQVGEGGSRLSVGEKQLISFARALVFNPSIVILDEATSSIDSESEELIQQAVDHVKEDRTTFIIAHRLSTIKKCDLIICLQEGKIIEMGNHEQLLANQNYYYKLINSSQ